MNRRIAIRDLSLALGGLVSLPTWASDGWNASSFLIEKGYFNALEGNLLSVIVETIIPESTTKGAKSLGVPAFVEKMLQDCYEKEVSLNVKNGLAATEMLAQQQFGKVFVACDTKQKEAILLGFEKNEDMKLKEYYGLVKNLTILGYTTSEYVQTEFLHYNMAPGHYYGCVSVNP